MPIEPELIADSGIVLPTSLRDLYAVISMHALLRTLQPGAEDEAAAIPIAAYQIADAMLKARQRPDST